MNAITRRQKNGGRQMPPIFLTPFFCLLLTFARAVEVPPGFAVETLATGLNAATAFALAPDGRIFLADQTGPLRIWKDGALLPTPALDLSARLDTWWERGLVGITLDPDFPRTPHIFLLYVKKQPYPHHILARFTLDGDTIDPASEKILLEGDDQTLVARRQPAGHQGGPLRFGPDGKLYVALGEQSAERLSQSLEHLQGKILRLNRDGTIPADNPFFTRTTGKYRAIWAYGLRNPFGLAFQTETRRLFATDVGLTSWEEVNEIIPGANYGWPLAEGMSDDPSFRNPLHAYPPAIGRSIVGAAFCPRSPAAVDANAWPAAWRGKFFFADWAANFVKALDPESPAQVTTFARGLNGPVALEFAADGSLLVLNRGTIWRDGNKWKPASGSLVRLSYTGATNATTSAGVATTPTPAARTLRDENVFSSLAPLVTRDGFVEFSLIQPPWQPGATARRWLSLPMGSSLAINADGEFEYPAGAVVVQHYLVAKTGAPFETHVFRFETAPRSRLASARAFRWNAGGSDATLVEDGTVIPLPGDTAHRWLSPGYEQKLKLDATVIGFLLPLSPRQLDTAQLAAWSARGWLSPRLAPAELAAFPRLVSLDDPAAPLESRVRSYFDVNCALCHRPGGLARGHLDLRHATPNLAARLSAADLFAGDLGLTGARLLTPGDPEKSILYQRILRTDPFRMPAIAVNDDAQPILGTLAEWIRSLARP